MKIILFILFVLFFAGCGMTFEERKQTIAECEEMGLEWSHFYGFFGEPNVSCIDNRNKNLEQKRTNITDVAVKACLDIGGIPQISNWDSDVKCDVITSPNK